MKKERCLYKRYELKPADFKRNIHKRLQHKEKCGFIKDLFTDGNKNNSEIKEDKKKGNKI